MFQISNILFILFFQIWSSTANGNPLTPLVSGMKWSWWSAPSTDACVTGAASRRTTAISAAPLTSSVTWTVPVQGASHAWWVSRMPSSTRCTLAPMSWWRTWRRSTPVSRVRIMMTSSNGNIFRVTGHLCGRFPVNSPHKGQWRGALIFSLICTWINGWLNNFEAGDLRRKPAHYGIIVMCRGYGVWGLDKQVGCRFFIHMTSW